MELKGGNYIQTAAESCSHTQLELAEMCVLQRTVDKNTCFSIKKRQNCNQLEETSLAQSYQIRENKKFMRE